jgi:hypothetical protein
MLGNSGVAEQLVDFQEEVKSTELVDEAVRISGCITSSEFYLMNNEWNRCEKKQLWLILRCYPNFPPITVAARYRA